jgi:hypothetical protein
VNGTHPSRAKCFINPAVRNMTRAYKFNSQPSTIKTAQTTPTNLNNRNSPQYQYYSQTTSYCAKQLLDVKAR